MTTLPRASRTFRSTVTFGSGGEICQFIQDKWMGGVNPCKGVSMRIACVGDCTVCVATDQTHLVVAKSFEKNFVNPCQALPCTHGQFCEAHETELTDEVFAEFTENHPCFLAHKKTKKRLKAQASAKIPSSFLRSAEFLLNAKSDLIASERRKMHFGAAWSQFRPAMAASTTTLSSWPSKLMGFKAGMKRSSHQLIMSCMLSQPKSRSAATCLLRQRHSPKCPSKSTK